MNKSFQIKYVSIHARSKSAAKRIFMNGKDSDRNLPIKGVIAEVYLIKRITKSVKVATESVLTRVSVPRFFLGFKLTPTIKDVWVDQDVFADKTFVEKRVLITRGLSLLHDEDMFDKYKGRELALEDAINNLVPMDDCGESSCVECSEYLSEVIDKLTDRQFERNKRRYIFIDKRPMKMSFSGSDLTEVLDFAKSNNITEENFEIVVKEGAVKWYIDSEGKEYKKSTSTKKRIYNNDGDSIQPVV